MALQSKRVELLAAWRALSGPSERDGWRTIPVAHGGPCRFLAGRRFPGNEESLLIRFGAAHIPPLIQFPEGRGFMVARAMLEAGRPDAVWISLSRQSAGSLDLFALMADDVVTTLHGAGQSDDEGLFRVFLARIRAWQDFMRRGRDGVLTAEAETGLFGELELLHEIISAGLGAPLAMEGWQGPLDGVRDIVLGSGAIEVKTTVSPNGFPATIGSLEQLDDSLTRPIFLAGIRLTLSVSGRTLPEQAGRLGSLLAKEPLALNLYRIRLLQAGFFEGTAEYYTRRFTTVEKRLLLVDGHFPRLTRANVASTIGRVRYEIDLDQIPGNGMKLESVLEQLGMSQGWN